MGKRSFGTGALSVELGRVIRDHLRPLRMAEVELAEAVGVSRHSMGRWLNGERAMTVDHLAIIATILGVNPSALVGEAERALLGQALRPIDPHE